MQKNKAAAAAAITTTTTTTHCPVPTRGASAAGVDPKIGTIPARLMVPSPALEPGTAAD